MIGILLVNLGTPDSPHPKDVYRYLIEFLTDERVIDFPWLPRQLLVRGLIVPFRYRQSARSYRAIWTEEGSPLMVYGQRVKTMLQTRMKEGVVVELAMRYQNPSLKSVIDKLLRQGVDHLVVLPLFPQYASATTGSVHERVMKILSQYQVIPKITLINNFATHPAYIEALCETAKDYDIAAYDHILFSFHGLPKRHVVKADQQGHCQKKNECCLVHCDKNRNCYSAQCYATAQHLAQALSIENYSICFQSRLGKDPWLEPFTSEVIQQLAKQGKKKVLVFCPSFVCDCLETIYEIGVEYKEEFLHAGGEKLDFVRGLNDHPKWIEALENILKTEQSGTNDLTKTRSCENVVCV